MSCTGKVGPPVLDLQHSRFINSGPNLSCLSVLIFGPPTLVRVGPIKLAFGVLPRGEDPLLAMYLQLIPLIFPCVKAF